MSAHIPTRGDNLRDTRERICAHATALLDEAQHRGDWARAAEVVEFGDLASAILLRLASVADHLEQTVRKVA